MGIYIWLVGSVGKSTVITARKSWGSSSKPAEIHPRRVRSLVLSSNQVLAHRWTTRVCSSLSSYFNWNIGRRDSRFQIKIVCWFHCHRSIFDVFVSRRRKYFKCFEPPPQTKCQGFGINCLIDLDTVWKHWQSNILLRNWKTKTKTCVHFWRLLPCFWVCSSPGSSSRVSLDFCFTNTL